MAQSTPEIHFSGLRPEPRQGFAPGPHWGGGGVTAPPPPPAVWLLAMLVCNALRALHNALRVLSILCHVIFLLFHFMKVASLLFTT